MNMARRLDTRQQWSSSNNISQSGNNKNTQLTFTKVVEILVEDFIGPLLCFGQNCRGNVKSKRHHPYGTNRAFSRKAKSLMSDEENSTASTDVDSYYEEESMDTRDYDPTAPLVRQRRERIVCDDSSINDELTDFQALTSLRRSSDPEEEDDPRDVVYPINLEDPLLEHEELRKELQTIRAQSSRLQSENTNLRRLYETSKLSHNVQETVNQRLKVKNNLLHQEGQTLQQELEEMKGRIEILRLEQLIMEEQMVR